MNSPFRFGFLSPSGLNQFVSAEGVGIHFELVKNDCTYRRFFPNVGQPNQNPPIHSVHRDNLSYWDDLELLEANFDPFYAEYRLLGNNRFRWWEFQKGKVLLEAELEDECVFYPIGDALQSISTVSISSKVCVSGIDFNNPCTGKIRAILDFKPTAKRILPKHAPKMTKPLRPDLHPAQMSVFYNLSTSVSLSSRYYVPVNKTWPRVIAEAFSKTDATDGPLQFAWDAAFSSIILARFDIELAKATLSSLLENMQSDGRIPQVTLGRYVSNRSNPPIWFFAAKEIFDHSFDTQWLASVYGLLLKNYRWFKSNRMNSDSTFSWGTDNEDDSSLLQIKGAVGAAYESGLDDSPLFAEMSFNGHSFDQACIDLSSLMFSANEVLLSLAQHLQGQNNAVSANDLAELTTDRQAFEQALHLFFDLENKQVNSFIREGDSRRFCSTLTPLVFYPLLTSFVNAEEVQLLKDTLYSDSFSSPNLLPSLDSCSEHFNGDGDYWRGRIWPPLVYLTALGFKRWDQAAYEHIKSAATALLGDEWERHHHIHENYSALTGDGEPLPGAYARSCPLYSWGGLLGII